MEQIYNCEQVAQRYGVNKKTVWKWIKERKLSAIKVGKLYRIKENDLEDFENKNKII